MIGSLQNRLIDWLTYERTPTDAPLNNFERTCYEVRPADVILVEGVSRVSEIIKWTTQSPWSHAALYIGRLHDINDSKLRERVRAFYHGDPNEQLLIENEIGRGTVITPLNTYAKLHLRICRPKNIIQSDVDAIVGFMIGNLGRGYSMRHIFDLFRFLLPWKIIPRRWLSSLFLEESKINEEICSSLIARAFESIRFPILPIVMSDNKKGYIVHRRNTKLFTPRDFDYSPYFSIIKYPFFDISEQATYRNLPWVENDDDDNPPKASDKEEDRHESAPESS